MAAIKTVALRVEGSRPWMGLPAERVGKDATVTDTLAAANMLGWNVHTRLIVTDAETDKDDFEVLRTNPATKGLHRLSVCGQRYEPVQVEELAEMADKITEGDIEADVVGSYNSGRNVFMTFCLGPDIILDPEGQADHIGRYFSIISSNDGSAAIRMMTHNLRNDCQNMLRSIRAEALSTFTMRHTASVKGRMEDARKALSIAFRQSAVFEEEMNALLAQSVSDQQFWELVKTIYPEPKADVRGSVAKWEDKTSTIQGIWNGATCSGLENTAYKAYNALNEHLLWYPGIRAGNTESALVRASGFSDASNKANLTLFRKVLASV